jgi:hypothetical protein
MLWTFHRRGQRFHYEIHQAENGLGFELVLYHPDGRQTTERLADSAALNRRALELQRELLADSWFISSDPRR